VIANLGLIQVYRVGWSRNAVLYWVVGVQFVLLALLLHVPLLKNLFRFGSLSISELGAAVGIGMVSVVLVRVIKLKERL